MRHAPASIHQGTLHKLGESQMTLSPKFGLAPKQSSSPLESNTQPTEVKPLLPGLPDDIALNCLLQFPVETHSSCRIVCKRWHELLSTKKRFFTLRKELGYQDPWLFISTYQKCTGKIQWQVLDLTNFSWHIIPPMPCMELVHSQGFQCVSMPHQGSLFVCGGTISDTDSPVNLVLKYEIHKNRWSVMEKMKTARSFFASGVIDGLVYVAGGNSSELYELESGEVLDPVKGNWKATSSMNANMASYDSAVLNGKLLVTEGWLWPFMFSPRGQTYDPRSNTWENMSTSLSEGWTGLSVVIKGKLFVVSERERTSLKVYDEKTDSWDVVAGSPVPELIEKPFSVSSNDCRIFVVGCNLHVAIGYVTKMNLMSDTGKNWYFLVEWKTLKASGTFSGWSPSNSLVLYG